MVVVEGWGLQGWLAWGVWGGPAWSRSGSAATAASGSCQQPACALPASASCHCRPTRWARPPGGGPEVGGHRGAWGSAGADSPLGAPWVGAVAGGGVRGGTGHPPGCWAGAGGGSCGWGSPSSSSDAGTPCVVSSRSRALRGAAKPSILLHTPFFCIFFFFIAGRCLLFIILPPHTPFSSCSLAVLVGSDMNNSLYRHLSCYLYLSREGKGIGTRAGRACVAPMGVSGTALRGDWGGAWRTPEGPRAAGQGATCVGMVRRGRSRVGRGCSLLPAIIWQSRRGGLVRVEGAMELRAGGGRDVPGGPVGVGDPAVSPWKRVGARAHPPEVPPRAPAARSCRRG